MKSFDDIIKKKIINKTTANISNTVSKKEIPKLEVVYDNSNSHEGSKYALWFVAFLSLVFLVFAFSFLFSGATVTINPKMKDLNLNTNLSAVKDSNTEGLSFDLVVFSDEETKSLSALSEKEVKESAKGKVILYNNFSNAPQKLKIDTRLEGSNGKMYKTDQATVIPGMIAGKPGSVEVGIYADIAGAEGNSTIGLDFKIFGFKGTSKYAKFYARSVGEIKGGFTGKVAEISPEDKASSLAEMKNSLQNKLIDKVRNQIPTGFILFQDAVFLDVDAGTLGALADGKAPLTLKGTLYGFLFNEEKLTKKIITDNLDKYDGASVYISNIKDLVFSFINKESISFADVKNINFNLSGTAKIIWKVDEEKVKNDLLGKRKKDAEQILLKYINIESGNFVVKPAWKMSFPEKLKDIKVVINYPKQ